MAKIIPQIPELRGKERKGFRKLSTPSHLCPSIPWIVHQLGNYESMILI
jgi:hypothetical protein